MIHSFSVYDSVWLHWATDLRLLCSQLSLVISFSGHSCFFFYWWINQIHAEVITVLEHSFISAVRSNSRDNVCNFISYFFFMLLVFDWSLGSLSTVTLLASLKIKVHTSSEQGVHTVNSKTQALSPSVQLHSVDILSTYLFSCWGLCENTILNLSVQ